MFQTRILLFSVQILWRGVSQNSNEIIQSFWQLFNPFRTDGDFCHRRAGHRNWPKTLRLSKPTDMTIHWKGLGKHFLMVPLVVRFNQFSGEKSIFSIFLIKSSVLKELGVLGIFGSLTFLVVPFGRRPAEGCS
jgi:hypothetical protein